MESIKGLLNGKLYHATYKPLLKSIKLNGLGGSGAKPQYTDSKCGVVYLAKDPDIAFSYAECADNVPEDWEIVVLDIDVNSLDLNNLYGDENVLDDNSTMEYHGVIQYG